MYTSMAVRSFKKPQYSNIFHYIFRSSEDGGVARSYWKSPPIVVAASSSPSGLFVIYAHGITGILSFEIKVILCRIECLYVAVFVRYRFYVKG